MLELVVVIFIARAFRSKAKSKGLSPFLWALLGMIAYYAPIAMLYFVVFPELIENGTLVFRTQIQGMLFVFLINISSGILCSYLLYRFLSGMNSRFTFDENLIDDMKQ
jgi:hypothetical protein